MAGSPRILASALALILVVAAGAGDVPIHEKGLLPGDAAVAPAWNSQPDVAVSSAGNRQLAVWSDYRSQGSGNSTNQSAGDIFGIRLDSLGNPLDPVPFAVNTGPGEQRYPVVAWNGSNWLVVFRSQDPNGGYYENQIRAVRVSPEGVVLDSVPLLIGPSELPFHVAGQDGQWIITFNMYRDGGYGTNLVGRRISNDGVVMDGQPRVLLEWSYGASAVVSGGGDYLVAGADWTNSNVIRARRIGLDGWPIGDEFNVPSLNLAASEFEYYVAWLSDYTNLVGSRLSREGELSEPDGTLLTANYSSYHQYAVARSGSQWWIEWGAADFARLLRVDDNGEVLDDGGGISLPVGGGGFLYSPQVQGRSDGGVHFYWSDSRQGDSNVWCIPVSAGNVASVERCASTGTGAQLRPDWSRGPDGRSAIVFTSRFAADQRVLVHLVDARGDSIWNEPVEVRRGPNLGRAGIAWNGSAFLVVWDEGEAGLSTTQVKARRMNPDGTFIDAQPFDIMPGFSPDVEALGDDFLVTCSRFATYPQTIYALARRVDGPTGQLLDAGPLTLLAGYVSTGPRVRTDGQRWIVTYHSHWTHDSSQSDAVYNFVHADGSFTPARNPATTSGGAGTPDVAYSGSKFLFVWRSNSLANANNYISGRIMNPDGSFDAGSFVIAEAPGRQLCPVVVWNGSEFVVAWDDQRNQQVFFDERTDIYAARVTESGTVLDPAGIAIVDNPDGDVTTAVHSPSPQVTMVASARFVTQQPFDSYRVGITMMGTSSEVADLRGYSIVTGSNLSGTLDDLRESDDRWLRNRSGFGRTFSDLHHLEFLVDAHTDAVNAAFLDLTIEGRIDQPTGSARIRLRNFDLNRWDQVHSGAIGTTERTITIPDIPASAYVDGTGNLQVSIKQIVVIPIFAFTFESFTDHVEVAVR